MNAPKNIEEIFALIQNERGGLASIHTAFKDFPEGVLAHYLFYKSIILKEDLPLKRAEREYLAYKTSEYNQCPYCIGHHKTAFDNFKKEKLDEKRLVLLEELAQKLTKEPWKANGMKKKFLTEGFLEAEWQHAIMVVSYFNFANRCAHGMDLEIEVDFEKTCE